MEEKNELDALREKLLYKQKQGYDIIDVDERIKLEEYATAYKAYLNAARTEREAVKMSIEMAEAKGFVEYADGMELKAGDKVYRNNRGKSLMLALSQDLSQNRPAEAREHVRRFHELFFTLSPEKSAIEHNVKRALLLADKSVYNYYSDFAEKGYYNRIIAGNINQVLKVDSVVCDFNAYPYRAVTYATQKIIRQSNVTERSLVTTCRLLNSSRSDDNPNGFTIEGFTIIENKDLQTIKR